MATQQQEPTGIFRMSLNRIPLDSIPGRMAIWGPAAHAVLTLAGAGWSIGHEIAHGNHASAYALFQAIGYDVLWAFALSTAIVITIAEVIDAAMVMAYLVGQKMKADGFNEGISQGRAEGRDEGLKEGRDEGLKEGRDEGLKEGRDEGRAEGLEEGRAKKEAEVAEWFDSLLAAHPELAGAIEPPPVSGARRNGA